MKRRRLQRLIGLAVGFALACLATWFVQDVLGWRDRTGSQLVGTLVLALTIAGWFVGPPLCQLVATLFRYRSIKD